MATKTGIRLINVLERVYPSCRILCVKNTKASVDAKTARKTIALKCLRGEKAYVIKSLKSRISQMGRKNRTPIIFCQAIMVNVLYRAHQITQNDGIGNGGQALP